MRDHILDCPRPTQDQLGEWKIRGLSVSRKGLRGRSQLEQGEEVKITLLGVLSLVAVGVLLLYVAKQMQEDQEKEMLSGYPTSSLKTPDTLKSDPGEEDLRFKIKPESP